MQWHLPILPLLSALALVADASHADSAATPDALFDERGYRIDRFLAPVPDRAPSATTLSIDEASKLHAEGRAIFVDVLPTPPRPAGLAPGTLWLPPAHESIPGAVWLPNVGYGRLSDALERYLSTELERLTGGDRDRAIALFCKADCWMSWNAAKRVAAMGYREVYWIPEGTTGWTEEGLALEPVRPLDPMGPGAGADEP